ncbi:S41 family peptidase [Brevibacillus daliensis]|uniref:S41 family peptidase n=1 Tax=Brevibacillus daliensis TaxID=2892995 RepID=UPI001E6298AF|nr:S41 family peptidase [Brevibacillus daliensis]
MKANKLISLLLALFLLVTGVPAHVVYAQEQAAWQQDPMIELQQVYYILQENHLKRPTEQMLVKGALQEVSDFVLEEKRITLPVDKDDDTLEEMVEQLSEWQKSYKLNWKDINYYGIVGMVETVNDPYTNYFTLQDFIDFQNSVDNTFVGFGILLNISDEGVVIRGVLKNSPAANAGLVPGDRLIAIDQKKIAVDTEVHLEEFNNLLRGEEGSEAVLTVFKPSLNKQVEYKLKRAKIISREANGHKFQSSAGTFGYIQLETFGSEASYQFKEELDKLENSGKKLSGLLIDLRNNGGGYLFSAQEIASLFMEEGILMYTTNRNDVEVATWIRNGRPVSYPVRILINDQTASASEMLAGALRDNQVAKLVGTTSYGKGVAQNILPLVTGDSALKVTLHEYLTPKKQKVNEIGLTPDIISNDVIGQVVDALYSMGEKRIEIKQISAGEVVVNGVPFFTPKPIVTQTTNGMQIRSELLDSLLQKPKNKVATEYVPLVATNTADMSVSWKKDQDQIVIVSQKIK